MAAARRSWSNWMTGTLRAAMMKDRRHGHSAADHPAGASSSAVVLEDGALVWGYYVGFPMWPAQVIPLELCHLALGRTRFEMEQELFVEQRKRQKHDNKLYLVRYYGDGSYDFLSKKQVREFQIGEKGATEQGVQATMRNLRAMKGVGKNVAEANALCFRRAVWEMEYCAHRRRGASQAQLMRLFPDVMDGAGEIDLQVLDIGDHNRYLSYPAAREVAAAAPASAAEGQDHKNNDNNGGGGLINQVRAEVGVLAPEGPAPKKKRKKKGGSTLVGLMMRPTLELHRHGKGPRQAAMAPAFQGPSREEQDASEYERIRQKRAEQELVVRSLGGAGR